MNTAKIKKIQENHAVIASLVEDNYRLMNDMLGNDSSSGSPALSKKELELKKAVEKGLARRRKFIEKKANK